MKCLGTNVFCRTARLYVIKWGIERHVVVIVEEAVVLFSIKVVEEVKEAAVIPILVLVPVVGLVVRSSRPEVFCKKRCS